MSTVGKALFLGFALIILEALKLYYLNRYFSWQAEKLADLSLISGFVIVVLMFVISRFRNRTEHMANIVESMTSGDFSNKIIVSNNNDELGKLAHSLNSLNRTLRSFSSKISDKSIADGSEKMFKGEFQRAINARINLNTH
jgi:methyl-accepting chemotaxis protein